MSLTAEEQRALNYNQSTKRRALAVKARKKRLCGNEQAAADLLANTEALTREGLKTGRQKDLIRYDERFDYTLSDDD